MSAPLQQPNLPDNALEGGVGWINTRGPIHLPELRGKVVLLDFWTYCCINCHHILPDLEKLEKKYAQRAGRHRRPHGQVRRRERHRQHPQEGRGVPHPAPGHQRRQPGAVEQVRRQFVADPGAYRRRRAAIGGPSPARATTRCSTGPSASSSHKHRQKGELNETPLYFEPEVDRPVDSALLYPGKIARRRRAAAACSSPTPATTGSSSPTSTASTSPPSATARPDGSTAPTTRPASTVPRACAWSARPSTWPTPRTT